MDRAWRAHDVGWHAHLNGVLGPALIPGRLWAPGHLEVQLPEVLLAQLAVAQPEMQRGGRSDTLFIELSFQ